MALPTECVLHSPRLALFYAPGFSDVNWLHHVLGALIRTSQKDWEIAFPVYALGQVGPTQQYCQDHNLLTSGFVVGKDREATYRSMIAYVSHAVVFRDIHDGPLENVLNDMQARLTKVRTLNVWETTS